MTKLLWALAAIAIGLLLTSCSSNPKPSNDPATVNKPDLESEVTEVTSTALKEDLHGIWSSKDYLNSLIETGSLTNTIESFFFYVSIVFDGNTTLHCYMPDYMEEDYLSLLPDSSVLNRNKEVVFRITEITHDTMIVVDSTGTRRLFLRLAEQADYERLYLETRKGQNLIEWKWLAGNYDLKSDEPQQHIELTSNGSVKGSTLFNSFYVYSYGGLDMLSFDFDEHAFKSYVLEFQSESRLILREIHPIESDDAPVVYTGTIDSLIRR